MKKRLFALLFASLLLVISFFIAEEYKKETPTHKIILYYYNPNADQDESGNILCSRQGIQAVERFVDTTPTAEEAIVLLLRGELTDEERARGLTTEYPLSGFTLEDSLIENGILTLRFRDPEMKTSGGSCRVGILWFQIEATAKQFPGIDDVRFEPEDLFQP